MRMKLNVATLALAGIPMLFLLLSPVAFGQTATPPKKMSYQGYLVDASGLPLGNTNTGPRNYDVIFRLYSQQSGTTNSGVLWAEQQTVTVDKGYFSVLLGEGTSYPPGPWPTLHAALVSTNTADRYIGMVVKGLGASDVEIAPRLQLMSSPYAFLAQNAVALVNTNGSSLLSLTNGIAQVTGSLTVTGNLRVNGGATNVGPLVVSNSIRGTVGLHITGNSTNTGTLTVGTIVGNGSGLTNLNASSLTNGTINVARLPSEVITNQETSVTLSGTFSGNGSGLTSLNASSLATGTISDARLSANIISRGLLAWGRIAHDGSTDMSGNFGVTSAVRNSAGVYTITLSTAADLYIPVAQAELDSPPTSSSTIRIVSIDQITPSSTFKVYINNGSGTAVDNDFVFHVTGR